MYISTEDINIDSKPLSDAQASAYRRFVADQARRYTADQGRFLDHLALIDISDLTSDLGNANTVKALVRKGMAHEMQVKVAPGMAPTFTRVYLTQEMLDLISPETIKSIESGAQEDAEWAELNKEQRAIAVSIMQAEFLTAAPALQGIPSQTDGQDLAEVFEEYADDGWIPSGTMVPVESLLQIAQRIQELEAAAK